MFKKIISLVAVFAVLTTSAFSASFIDFDTSHWAQESVFTLVNEGTIKGYEDGSFKPNGTVTRAEFVKMLGKSETKFQKDFNDVPADHWAYDYVMYSGLEGDSAGNFNPNVPISRNDVVNLLWKRAGSQTGNTVPQIVYSQGTNKEAVSWAYATGIMNGNDGVSLRLNDTMSRAEGAVLIIRSRNKNVTPKNFIDTVSNEVLEMVYNDTLLLSTEVPFSLNQELTNGEVARAASHLRTDETDMSYYGHGAKKPDFEHKYGVDLYLACKDVLGMDKLNIEFADQKATIEDTIAMLTYSLAVSSNDTIKLEKTNNYYKNITSTLTDNKNKALTFAYENNVMLTANNTIDPNKITTIKDLSAIIMQLDSISGVFNKLIVTAGEKGVYTKVKTPSNFDASTFPANKAYYQVLTKEIPTNIYTQGLQYTDTKNPKNKFKYAREFYFVFNDYLVDIANNAKRNGVDVKFTYYPSTVYGSQAGYLIRLKCEVVSAKDGAKLNDIYTSNVNLPLIKGMNFFMDMHTHQLEIGFDIPVEKTTIDRIVAIN